MKKALVILLVASLLVMPLVACSKNRISQNSELTMSTSEPISEPTPTPTPIPQPTPTSAPELTIKSVEIILGNNSFDINPVMAIDEAGQEIELPSPTEWFEATSIVNITMPAGTNLQITESGVFLADDSLFEISVEIGDKKYTCLLKVGSRFNYTSDGSGKIKIIINDAFTLEGSDENKGSTDSSDNTGSSCPSDTPPPSDSSIPSGGNNTGDAISSDTPAPTPTSTPAPTPTPKAEPEKIVFNDSNLEGVIRSTIGKPSGTVTVDDVKKVTSLDASGIGIKDIGVLKYFVSLQVLHIEGNNEIFDLSPLKQLVSLKELYGYSNKIADLSPLKNLVGLEKLYLCWNNFSDLSPLSGLKNLQELSFGDMSITDVSPLKNLTKLRILRAYGNKITDISPLRNLINLVELDLSSNPIKDYSPIEGLNIQNLYK